jgi:hypothetical protein
MATKALCDERARELPVLVERLVRTRQRKVVPVTTRAPAIPRIRRKSCCAQIAPYSPVVAPAMATVLFRSQLPRCRAETQSIAFFRTPVVDPLYPA